MIEPVDDTFLANRNSFFNNTNGNLWKASYGADLKNISTAPERMGIEKVYIDLDVEIGETIKVIRGPFEGFMGAVEEINKEKQIVKVKVSMFGRETPVELEFSQVDKI